MEWNAVFVVLFEYFQFSLFDELAVSVGGNFLGEKKIFFCLLIKIVSSFVCECVGSGNIRNNVYKLVIKNRVSEKVVLKM